MTKYLNRDTINKHMLTMGQEIREGRAEKGLEMQGSQAANAEGSSVQVHVAAVSKQRPAAFGLYSRDPGHTDRESHACVYSLESCAKLRGLTNMQRDSRQQGAASAAPRARVSCCVMGNEKAPSNFQSGPTCCEMISSREQPCAAPRAWTSHSTTARKALENVGNSQ